MAREIYLGGHDRFAGMAVVVDDDDYAHLSQFVWIGKARRSGTVYAQRSHMVDLAPWLRGCLSVLMHREIMGEACPAQIDHIDGNGLNNQRSNLRAATGSQNQQNRGKITTRATSSRFKGVSWSKAKQKWRATIASNNTKHHLGQYSDEVEAAKAYDAAAVRLHGAFARLNFPPLAVAS